MLDGSEHSMVGIIEDQRGVLLAPNPPDSYHIQTEFASGPGVADLVFCLVDTEILQDRIKNALPPLTSPELVNTLIFINKTYRGKQPVTLGSMTDNLPYSAHQLAKRILPSLVEERFVEEVAPASFRPSVAYRTGTVECIAVEAKVSDWKRGLYQAYRYRWFSDMAYLALYNSNIRAAVNHLHLFKSLNIGLIGVTDGEVAIYRKPRRQRPFSPALRAFAFESLLLNLQQRKKGIVARQPFARASAF